MLTFAYYLLKIIICSGILYGYYLMALRDKIFHRWNRFYLLAAVVLALTTPLIKINIWQAASEPKTKVIQLLQVVNSNDEIVFEYTKSKGGFQIDASNLSLCIYIVVSGMLLGLLLQTLLKINRLKKNNKQTIVEGVNFINTNARGTPFSFFNNIFWNDKIDINSSTGKQIFQHEIVHVLEKHSYDKVFINVVLIFFWCNPFFWLMRKELNMIHEFIADKKSLEDSDSAAFAAMILKATFPYQQFNITNNFFYSPLKRRLLMLAKNKNPKISYVSRLIVLPLTALVFLAFTLKMNTIRSTNHYVGKKLNVVIDAGHGGDDNGAMENNIREKDLTLSIAREIKEMNKNENINVILSREQDENLTPTDRIKFTQDNKTDIFISIHIDKAINNNTQSGLGILIPNNDNTYLNESKLLGSAILQYFKKDYPLQIAELKQPDKGVWLLKANHCPAILIEAGFLNFQKDLEYLIKHENQKTIARNILNGIEKYAQQTVVLKSENKMLVRDTIPETKVIVKEKDSNNALIIVDGVKMGRDKKSLNSITPASIQTVSVLKSETATKKYGDEGKDGVIEITTKTIKNDTIPHKPIYTNTKQFDSTNKIYIINGQIFDKEKLKYKNIEAKSARVYGPNNKEAIELYGEAAKNGVMVFTDAVISDKLPVLKTDTVPKYDKVFTKVEVEPSFPGGDQAWTRYVMKNIKEHLDELTDEGKSGTCRVRFIVDTQGNIDSTEALTMKGTKLAEVAINAIKKGPRWIPAKQNERIVTAYKEAPITFTIAK